MRVTHGGVLKWSKRRDSKSRRPLTRRVGSNPTSSAIETTILRSRLSFLLFYMKIRTATVGVAA